ncbi:hypothetical protein GCM10009665_44630 [Kitasatospora nipponensis]|uniref:DUF2568 domain-containing protein n=1 Tax=Kitasatospora nipponensis TaxID=258049 RepID=A0ABN1WG58_9ACTN
MLPKAVHYVNEGVAFLVELAALGFLAWWGFTVGDQLIWHLLLGLGAPLAAAVLWGRYAAPRATVKLPLAGVLVVKAVVFAAGAAALAVVAGPLWGAGFAVFVLVNTVLATLDREALMNQVRER